MPRPRKQISKFEMVGGRPCLDFTNTVSGIRGGETTDSLGSYADLLAWAEEANLITKGRARELQQYAAGKYARSAARVWTRSLALREALYRIFSFVAAGKTAPAADLELFNRELAEAMTNVRVVPSAKRFDWQLPPEECGMFLPLQAVVRDAAELLTSRHLVEVRECSAETCGWLFLDTTKNKIRRWCDMRVCGNRVKQTRFRRRL